MKYIEYVFISIEYYENPNQPIESYYYILYAFFITDYFILSLIFQINPNTSTTSTEVDDANEFSDFIWLISTENLFCVLAEEEEEEEGTGGKKDGDEDGGGVAGENKDTDDDCFGVAGVVATALSSSLIFLFSFLILWSDDAMLVDTTIEFNVEDVGGVAATLVNAVAVVISAAGVGFDSNSKTGPLNSLKFISSNNSCSCSYSIEFFCPNRWLFVLLYLFIIVLK